MDCFGGAYQLDISEVVLNIYRPQARTNLVCDSWRKDSVHEDAYVNNEQATVHLLRTVSYIGCGLKKENSFASKERKRFRFDGLRQTLHASYHTYLMYVLMT